MSVIHLPRSTFQSAMNDAYEALSLANDAVEARSMSESPASRQMFKEAAIRRLHQARDFRDTMAAIAAVEEEKVAIAISALEELIVSL